MRKVWITRMARKAKKHNFKNKPMVRILRILPVWGVMMMVMALMGCKPGVPKQFLQPKELEDILYDYHVADGMAYAESNYSDLAYRRQAYREAALRKHGITEAELDSSLVYYYRHADRLHEIYANLAKRLNNDAIALGATANELSQFGGVMAQGDTATVWRNERSTVLIPQAPYNTVSFDVKADSAYHPGDKMILSFDNQFILQEGIKDGIALLAVTYKNDSTATMVDHITSDLPYNLQLSDEGRVGIKRVWGFIHLGKGNYGSTPSQSLKLMSVSNMRLLRMHTAPPKKEGEEDELENGATGITPPSARPSVSMRPEVSDGQGQEETPRSSAQPNMPTSLTPTQ